MVVSPHLICQFGPILLGKTSDGVHFLLVRATKFFLKKCSETLNIPQKNIGGLTFV